MKTIVFQPKAAKQLDKLPAAAREQISDGLDKYAIDGTGDVKKLRNRPGFRLRLGHFPVIFEEDLITIVAIEVLKRDTQTYK